MGKATKWIGLGCGCLTLLGVAAIGLVVVVVGGGAGAAVWLTQQSGDADGIFALDDMEPQVAVGETTPAEAAIETDDSDAPDTDGAPAEAGADAVADVEVDSGTDEVESPPPAPAAKPTTVGLSTPAPAKATPPPKAPTPQPTPAKQGSRVTVQGGAKVTLLLGAKRYALPASVPAGSYKIEAAFPGEPPVTVGSIRVQPGVDAVVLCNARMGICRPG